MIVACAASERVAIDEIDGQRCVAYALQMDVMQVPAWRRYGWLRHGFSTRAGGCSKAYAGSGGAESGGAGSSGNGDLNLGFTKEDDSAIVEQNRAKFVRAIAQDQAARLATVRQVHGTCIQVVCEGGAAGDADGLMTETPGVMLGIQVADCVPVLVADTRLRVVAVLHAGWRGTAAGMVEQGIGRMRVEFGSRSEDLIAAVGPSIGACCYTVGDEVRATFAAQHVYASLLFETKQDGLHLDLAEANRRQLLEAGVRGERVTVVGECTACMRVDGRRKYFSHRAEQGRTGRAMGMIGISSS